jgi:hypothetical protein
MTQTRRTVTFRIDDELYDGLQLVWDRDGVPVSEQIRRSIHDWLEKHGVSLKKTKRKRAGTRKRS